MSLFSHGDLSFRPVESKDLEKIAALRNDESTWTMLGDPRPVKVGLQQGWLDGLNRSSDRHYFVVEQKESGIWIGMIRMDEMDLQNRSIRIGADVAVGLRGQGYGTKIYEALKRYCFDELGMHRVWLCVLETNKAALALYKKTGFKLEGRYRKAVWRSGRYVDYLLMSILSDEYSSHSTG